MQDSIPFIHRHTNLGKITSWARDANSRDRDETETRRRASRERLETETLRPRDRESETHPYLQVMGSSPAQQMDNGEAMQFLLLL